MKHSADIPVHDIAPLVEVDGVSILPFLSLLIVISLAAILVKRFRKPPQVRAIDERTQRYQKLCAIDLKDAKRAAYAISEWGSYFAKENEHAEELYRQLFKQLERYKYAQEVPSLDQETIELYNRFMETIESNTI